MKRKRWALIGFAAVLIAAAAVAWLLMTNTGSQLMVRLLLRRFTQADKVAIGSSEGHLTEGMTLQDFQVVGPGDLSPESWVNAASVSFAGLNPLEFSGLRFEMRDMQLRLPGVVERGVARFVEGDASRLMLREVELRGLRGLPTKSLLLIQEVETLMPPALAHLRAIKNARLRVGEADPMMLTAYQTEDILSGKAYAHTVDLRSFLNLLAGSQLVPQLTGSLSDMDLTISGQMASPIVKGRFLGNPVHYGEITVQQCDGAADLNVRLSERPVHLVGEIVCKSGILMARQTVVTLKPSRLIFAEKSQRLIFDVQGTSKVGATTIHIKVSGTAQQPDFKLTSEPSLPQGVLLVMLATGKTWQGASQALKETRMNVDLAKDALDYFLFRGMGGKLAKQLGIDAVHLRYDKDVKGVAVTKPVGESVSVTYGADLLGETPETTATRHSIGAQYQLDSDTAVKMEAEKKFLPQDPSSSGAASDVPASEDNVLLRFKKKF